MWVDVSTDTVSKPSFGEGKIKIWVDMTWNDRTWIENLLSGLDVYNEQLLSPHPKSKCWKCLGTDWNALSSCKCIPLLLYMNISLLSAFDVYNERLLSSFIPTPQVWMLKMLKLCTVNATKCKVLSIVASACLNPFVKSICDKDLQSNPIKPFPKQWVIAGVHWLNTYQ